MTERNPRFQGVALLGALVVATAATLITTPVSGAEAEEKFRETYEAFAVAMGTSNPPVIPVGTTATVQINITRWTTPEEREMLLTELVENGQEALVNALRKQKETGWILNRSRTMQSTRARAMMGTSAPSERLRYAWQIDLGDGKRRIVAALDRPIGFAESVRQPRWRDYDLTLIVMDVDEKGEGEGQLAMGVRLAVEPEVPRLVIESFGSEPVRLTRLRKR